MSQHQMPTTFGACKPVGWLMLGPPSQAQADELVGELPGAGWSGAAARAGGATLAVHYRATGH